MRRGHLPAFLGAATASFCAFLAVLRLVARTFLAALLAYLGADFTDGTGVLAAARRERADRLITDESGSSLGGAINGGFDGGITNCGLVQTHPNPCNNFRFSIPAASTKFNQRSFAADNCRMTALGRKATFIEGRLPAKSGRSSKLGVID
jgi:hypothetical protein